MGGPTTPKGFVQDGPPKGGFPAVNVRRNLPGGGMSTLATVGAIGATLTFGMVSIITANRQRKELKREETDIRFSILPFLQAETDVKLAFVQAKQLENEAEIMKDVPNWEAGANVYHSRYMNPMTVFGIN